MEWFGERTVSLVCKNAVKSLKEGVNKRIKLKPLSTGLKSALRQALEEGSRKVSYFLPLCKCCNNYKLSPKIYRN